MSSPPEIYGYEFQRKIGGGTVADVHLYMHLGRPTAVKVSKLAEPTLLDEAYAIASVSDHPHIVSIFDAGLTGDGRVWVAQQYCPNADLRKASVDTLMPVAQALQSLSKIASAVEAVHSAGIVHRDIKPANMLTTAYGEPVLADFGSADLGGGPRSSTEGVSVAFSAPEVVAGHTSGTVSSDVFSLGATLYALLEGRSPFAGSDLKAVMRNVLDGRMHPWRRDDINDSVRRVVDRALDRQAERRWDSADRLRRELAGLAQPRDREGNRPDAADTDAERQASTDPRPPAWVITAQVI